MVVIGFMALIQKLPFQKPNRRTYGDSAAILKERIMTNATRSSRIDIICDVYQQNSIKDGERASHRNEGMPLDIHSNYQTHSSLLNDWKESKEWLSSIWLAPCPRHRTQLLTISQEHPTSPTILKEKLQRGQLG